MAVDRIDIREMKKYFFECMRPEKYPSSTIIASHDEQKLQLSININYSEHKEI